MTEQPFEEVKGVFCWKVIHFKHTFMVEPIYISDPDFKEKLTPEISQKGPAMQGGNRKLRPSPPHRTV